MSFSCLNPAMIIHCTQLRPNILAWPKIYFAIQSQPLPLTPLTSSPSSGTCIYTCSFFSKSFFSLSHPNFNFNFNSFRCHIRCHHLWDTFFSRPSTLVNLPSYMLHKLTQYREPYAVCREVLFTGLFSIKL